MHEFTFVIVSTRRTCNLQSLDSNLTYGIENSILPLNEGTSLYYMYIETLLYITYILFPRDVQSIKASLYTTVYYACMILSGKSLSGCNIEFLYFSISL